MKYERRVVISLRVPPEVKEELKALSEKLREPITSIFLAAVKPLMPKDLLPDWRYYGPITYGYEGFESAVARVIQRRQRNTESKT